MFANSTRIGRVFGVDLRIDLSWVFIFILMTWNLVAIFTVWHPDWTPAGVFAVALTASLLFFVCILLHELAHSLVAIAQGTRVRSITLFLFGGVSDIEREPKAPLEEFLTAFAGPLTSIVLGFVFLLLASAITAISMESSASAWEAFVRLGPVGTLFAWLGPINIVIGIFNLLPAFPLDGGRILRSILWAIGRDLGKATRWASGIGATIGWLMVVAGLGMSFGFRVPFFGTGLANGLWLAFIGWFIATAARQTNARMALDQALSGITVEQLMSKNIPIVQPELPRGTVIQDYLIRGSDRAAAAVRGGTFLGLVCIADIRNVPPSQWNTTRVSDVMRSADTLTTTSPGRPLAEAFEQMARQDVDQLPVVDGERLVGVLRRRDIARWLELVWRPTAQQGMQSADLSGRSQPLQPDAQRGGDPIIRPV